LRAGPAAAIGFIDLRRGRLITSGASAQFSSTKETPVRYTRHELKQDKFAESAVEAMREVAEHRAGIIAIVISVVLLALLGSGIFWYMSSREEQATDALGQAMVTYNAPVVLPGTPQQGSMLTFHSDKERLIAAKNAFYAVSDKYGWTPSGQYARYMAAISEESLGNNKAAEDQLRALSNSHRHELAALAKYARASVYRAENRDSDATRMLQTLIDKPTISVPKVTAELALADLYLSQHQPDKAKALYDQIAKDNAKNALGEMAKARLDNLK
jgi:predicted negative regulator of RcsB-dependent stress response